MNDFAVPPSDATCTRAGGGVDQRTRTPDARPAVAPRQRVRPRQCLGGAVRRDHRCHAARDAGVGGSPLEPHRHPLGNDAGARVTTEFRALDNLIPHSERLGMLSGRAPSPRTIASRLLTMRQPRRRSFACVAPASPRSPRAANRPYCPTPNSPACWIAHAARRWWTASPRRRWSRKECSKTPTATTSSPRPATTPCMWISRARCRGSIPDANGLDCPPTGIVTATRQRGAPMKSILPIGAPASRSSA